MEKLASQVINSFSERWSTHPTIVAVAALAVAGCGGESTDDNSTETLKTMTDPLTQPFAMLSADAPVAEKRPFEIEQHGRKRIDNYAWLRDEGWQDVLRDPAELDDDIRAQLDAGGIASVGYGYSRPNAMSG